MFTKLLHDCILVIRSLNRTDEAKFYNIKLIKSFELRKIIKRGRKTILS